MVVVTVLKHNPYTEEIGEVMSNFDHQIDEEVAKQLKSEEVFSRYPAMNFNAEVWYDRENKTYATDIWQYHVLIDTFKGTLKEIMKYASEKYGAE